MDDLPFIFEFWFVYDEGKKTLLRKVFLPPNSPLLPKGKGTV